MGKFYRLNDNIQSSELRVIDSKGEQLGILSKTDAIAKAKEQGKDLVEVASQATPPVARIVDFQKFRYEESKKERASKKDSGGGLKELWLSPRIEEHDIKVRLVRTEEFLKDGHKVRLVVKFKGREMAHKELGLKVLDEALALLGDKVSVEREPRFEGRNLSIILSKSRGGKVTEEAV